MANSQETNTQKKTRIYNLIVLDESGSMSSLTEATISGCNETINSIRSTQEEFAASQEHFLSIYVFQENKQHPSHYVVKNKPIAEVRDLTPDDYRPWGCTPLYDAVGSTLTDLKMTTGDELFAIGNVTIITDGMENASRHYSGEKVAAMIDALKEIGWSFNFIGANIDAESVARSMKIDNAMQFDHSVAGTRKMFEKQNLSRKAWSLRTDKVMNACCSAPGDFDKFTYFTKMKEAAADYFKKGEEEENQKD